ncbi:Asp23/Gls24 family envelope stress response protein [Agrococcus sp. Marseille-P2731]|uniref:Asp23/Gls24 family envelope stress response protein n=1 Tax=Agrococcus sp. Marseille-P2731 TaxID=1841862 RepID=UPI0009300F17|nr:Asp23/Gls24 family envelope stress response protein [Agrococcus sp. Marseille-P2731]
MSSTTPAAKVSTSGDGTGLESTGIHGTTVVVDPVVAKIAGMAAREVPGVHALGGGAARVVGAVRDAIGQSDLSQGVRVEVGEHQVAADVTIVVAYPEQLHVVAENVRQAVGNAIVELIGMEVAEVNVTVSDVHIPGDDEEPEGLRLA